MLRRHVLGILTSIGIFVSLGCSGGGSSASGSSTCDAGTTAKHDTPDLARLLDEKTDSPSSSQKFFVSFASASDVVFLKADVKDRGSGGDPKITVNAPAGYEVTTWFTCLDGGPISQSCRRGKETEESDIAPGKACMSVAPAASVTGTTDCSGSSDDDGTVLIRIRPLDGALCTDFEVTLEVTE